MKVILFKLDNPRNKHDWFVKDIEVKTLDDIVKLVGYCALHIYAELYQIDEDDDLVLVKKVKKCLSSYYPETAKDTIILLFKYVEKLTETWSEQRNKRSI